MPVELGLALYRSHIANGRRRVFIFESRRYRAQRSTSDVNAMDPQIHSGTAKGPDGGVAEYLSSGRRCNQRSRNARQLRRSQAQTSGTPAKCRRQVTLRSGRLSGHHGRCSSGIPRAPRTQDWRQRFARQRRDANQPAKALLRGGGFTTKWITSDAPHTRPQSPGQVHNVAVGTPGVGATCSSAKLIFRVAPRNCSSQGSARSARGCERSEVVKSEISDNFYSKGGAIMQQRTARVNPSEETIKIGPLGIRFLLTGDDSNGSVSVRGSRTSRAEAGGAGPQERRLRGDALRYRGRPYLDG
jgi:hypothetical protein